MSVAGELPRSRLLAAERSAVFLVAVGLMWLARNLGGLGSVAAWFSVVTMSAGFLFTAGKAVDPRPIARILDDGLGVRPWYRATVVPFAEISEVLGPVRTGSMEMLNPPGLVVLRISGDFIILNTATDEDLQTFRDALFQTLEATKR